MRILFCCQFYAPSVGGVQEVIKQLAERLVTRGHEVTVATTQLPNRNFDELNGVRIRGFAVSGNLAGGMFGDVAEYQAFIQSEKFDLMLVYAAQQWTFDALWDILGTIHYAKVFVPCGFSGFYEPGYREYYKNMPAILAQFDELLFNATRYRDIDFARANGLTKLTVIPNGASEETFSIAPDPNFRARHGIPPRSFLFLTVGSFTGLKGHLELAKAFAKLKLPEGCDATLILNGNEVQVLEAGIAGLAGKSLRLVKTYGISYSVRQIFRKLFGSSDSPRKIADMVNKSQSNKRVLVADFPRAELTQAFMAADLFVFVSNIEYSPLVLFEAAAAGTPFLTADVGNAAEIAQWTGAGVMCPSSVDKKGYTRVDEAVLAEVMGQLMRQPDRLRALGRAGKESWLRRYTWGKIATQYENIFRKLVNDKAAKHEFP